MSSVVCKTTEIINRWENFLAMAFQAAALNTDTHTFKSSYNDKHNQANYASTAHFSVDSVSL